MRILFISQYFYPEQFSNNEIASWLVKQGHEVDVVCAVPNYPEGVFSEGHSNTERREECWNGVRIHRAWTRPRGKSAWTLLQNFLTYPVAAIHTMRRHVGGRADVSFVSMPSPLTQALAGIYQKHRHKTPLVYWVQDIWPESLLLTLNIRNRFVVWVLMAFCGWIYRRADLIMVQSSAFPPMIERFGIDPEVIRVLPNTAPGTYFPMAADPESTIGRMMPNEGFRLMFAGNIGESQDFDTYLDAASILEVKGYNVAWLIVGSGRDLSRVESEVARRGLMSRFHFLGRHPEPDMPEFFSHADAMLVGLKDTPIFGMTVPYKVQCYMACGKPIVGSLSGEGARIIAQSGAGICAPAQSPEALVSAITQMVDASPQTRQRMAQAGRDFFEKTYAADKVYDNLQTWLQDMTQTQQSQEKTTLKE
ncbi:glycosyltransferase family 4 protein [Rhodobacteraceae bacterium M385]|nr:glycosyltransferase family 4 protein [Rhodobacteraceae bacterium M385]